MKKKFWIIIVIFSVLFWLGSSGLFNKNEVSNAQTSDDEYQKLLDRDKNVPKEQIDKAYAEAKKISDNIVSVIQKNKPEFKLYRKISGHLRSSNPGKLGETRDEITWRTTKTQLAINIYLGLNKESELILFRKSLNGVAMGDFFPLPNIGDEAILVKNVSANTKMTSVGLHFIKGRAVVDVYLDNYKRKTKENEKELMEILKLIEPLIVARPNFDD